MSMVLYGPDGNVLPPDAFRSPIDFGPGSGLTPRINEVNYPPREFQYVPGFNLIATPRNEQPGKRFADLRAYAQLCSYARIAISYRKAQITGLKWSIAPREEGDLPSARKKRASDIEPIEQFFRCPNRLDSVGWHQWIKQALEEVLVTDALVFYVHPSRDGSVHSFVQLDGGTIKPLIDQFGHVSGYQQILYGYPATYYPAFTADSDEDEPEAGRLRYLIANPRVDNVYGTSPLEEIAPILDTAIRRQLSHLAWYDEGNVPSAIMEAPPESTPDQIAQMQALYDRLLSGDDRQRHKVRIVPPGAKFTQLKPFEFSKEENDALISAVCAHFGVPRHLFVSETNRSTANQLSDDMADIGFRPLRTFFKDQFDRWIAEDFEQPDLEFVWNLEETGDAVQVAQAFKLYVDMGAMTPDEVRKERGLDPMPEEDKPKPVIPMQPGQFGVPAGNARAAGASSASAEAGAGEQDVEDEKKPVDEAAAKTELAQWRRFAQKRLARGRHADAFKTEHVPTPVRRQLYKALLSARTSDELKEAFEKAQGEIAHPFPGSFAVEQAIKGALQQLLSRRKAEALDFAREALG